MKFEICINNSDVQKYIKEEIVDNLTKKALEKQIPQKVRIIEGFMIMQGVELKQANCPSCDFCVDASVEIFRKYKYCCNCGQRLEWGDGE